MVAIEHWDLKCPANVDAGKDCSMFVEHFESVALVASLATSMASGSSGDEATFVVADSFVVITVETAPCIEDCFRVAVWQVFVLSWVNKLELVVERRLVLLPFDFRSSATCRVPFDEAFELDCDLAESDDSPAGFAGPPSPPDVDLRSTNGASLLEHVDFVVPNEIVAGIGIAVEFHAMILARVVGPPDSSKDVGADAIAVAADDFEVFVSSGIVGLAGCQLEAIQPDPDSVSDRSSSDPIPYDCSLDAVPTTSVSSDVGLRSHRKAEERELAVVASDTFDVHFVDNVEIFSAGLVADVVTEEWIHSLVVVSCHSSCSVATSTPLASAWDLAGSHSCADDNYNDNDKGKNNFNYGTSIEFR